MSKLLEINKIRKISKKASWRTKIGDLCNIMRTQLKPTLHFSSQPHPVPTRHLPHSHTHSDPYPHTPHFLTLALTLTLISFVLLILSSINPVHYL